MLSRELADFLVELSIAMHKHAIYPPGHPLLEGAVDAVARKVWGLLVDRPALAIGVARRQLVIEGVATDPNHPLLQELAQRLHRHHLGALKCTRGVERSEIAEALATLAMDAGRMARPLGLMTDELAGKWNHVRLYPLTYDRLELLDDDSSKPPENQMGLGRAAQLWVGLARAALAADASTSNDDSTPLEPAVIARAIEEHQREQAYDQVIVGYMLQIANELKGGSASGSVNESAALQSRISRMLGALQPETLARLLEMGGDKDQRRRFVLDASQGMTADAVVDLVKAAASAEKQNVSHSLIRVLSKMAKHAEASDDNQRAVADRSLREAVGRLVGQWSLDDPNPEEYRVVLDHVSRGAAPNGKPTPNETAEPTSGGCEPERIAQMALELDAVGAGLWRAVDRMLQEGQVGRLLDLLDGAPQRTTADAVLKHLADAGTLRRVVTAERVDFAVAERFVRLSGLDAVPVLLEAAEEATDARTRERLYDLAAQFGPKAGSPAARRLAEASQGGGRTTAQRDLLALLGRLLTPETPLPAEVDLRRFLRSTDAPVRREAVKLLLRSAKRDEAILAGLADSDGRIVYLALTAAHERCPREGLTVIRGRVERGELDAPLRALGIRAVATLRTPDTLRWLIDRATTTSALLRRQKLLPTSPETLAALSAIATGWPNDLEAGAVIALALRSRAPEVRASVKGAAAAAPKQEPSGE